MKLSLKHFIPLGLILAVPQLALAADAPPKVKAPKATIELLAKGKAVYAANCLTCHGEAADGMGATGMYLNPKPRNFATESFKQGNKVTELFLTASGGVPNTAMVGFPHLPEEDRWAAAYYVLSFVPTKDGKAAKKLADAAAKAEKK